MIEERINVKGTVGLDTINVYPTIQEKTVIPTTENQEIQPDENYYALSKVTVNKVTNEIDDNIQANNIKQGVSILGVEGNVVELQGETKEVTPTKNEQTILPSEGKNALTSVSVKPIPDEYIIPNGDIEVSQNGTYDVTSKATAKVNVKPNVGTKTITENGVYNASEDNLEGYSQINVETDYFIMTMNSSIGSNIYKYIKKVPQLDTSNMTSLSFMFQYCRSLQTIPQLDTSNVTDMNNMFGFCASLQTIPQLDTSKVTSFFNMFNDCTSLQAIPQLDTSNGKDTSGMLSNCRSLQTIPQLNTTNVINMRQMFQNSTSLQTIPQLDASSILNIMATFNSCISLENFGGLLNLGQAYDTTQSANYSYYTFGLSSCTVLTHDSLMNVINGLYDIATKGCNTQSLVLGSTNLAKLTSEEIAIATNKGWTVS